MSVDRTTIQQAPETCTLDASGEHLVPAVLASVQTVDARLPFNRQEVFCWDLLHLMYSVGYPAILGTFMYEMFVNKSDKTHAMLARRSVVVMIYCIDYILAKKLYEKEHANFRQGKLGVAVCLEFATAATLTWAFSAADTQNHVYQWYFVALGAFFTCILFFYRVAFGTFNYLGPKVWLAVAALVTAVLSALVPGVYGHDLYSAIAGGVLLVPVATFYVVTLESSLLLGVSGPAPSSSKQAASAAAPVLP